MYGVSGVVSLLARSSFSALESNPAFILQLHAGRKDESSPCRHAGAMPAMTGQSYQYAENTRLEVHGHAW